MTLIYLPDSRLVTQSRRRRITVITAAASRETHTTAVLCSVVRNITSLSYSCYISRRAAFTLYAFFHVCVKSWANKSFLCKPFIYLGLRCLDASTFYPTWSNILWLFYEKVKALILIIDDLGVFVVYLQTFGRKVWLCIAAVAPFLYWVWAIPILFFSYYVICLKFATRSTYNLNIKLWNTRFLCNLNSELL